jgi:hypothetical protein
MVVKPANWIPPLPSPESIYYEIELKAIGDVYKLRNDDGTRLLPCRICQAGEYVRAELNANV